MISRVSGYYFRCSHPLVWSRVESAGAQLTGHRQIPCIFITDPDGCIAVAALIYSRRAACESPQTHVRRRLLTGGKLPKAINVPSEGNDLPHAERGPH
jgi:hypothetical protein